MIVKNYVTQMFWRAEYFSQNIFYNVEKANS